MADTRSKYIPPDRASASYLGEEGREGGGKMQVRATIEGNKVSIVQTRSEGTGGGGERVGEKKARSRRNTMDGLDGSLVRCFIYADREEEGFSRSKFSWFVEDAMFPTTLSIDFDRFSFRSYRRELSNL